MALHGEVGSRACGVAQSMQQSQILRYVVRGCVLPVRHTGRPDDSRQSTR